MRREEWREMLLRYRLYRFCGFNPIYALWCAL